MELHIAWMSQKIDDNTIQCLACNHYCKIKKDKYGICGVRKNIDNELYLLVYNRPIAIHIDPIEKKPLYHFHPGKKVLSIGTYGCNFKCLFCQNCDISQVKNKHHDFYIKNSHHITKEQMIDICKKNNLDLIAYTYNEPTIFFEYAYDIAVLAHQNNIKNIFVSNGYMSKESRKKILPYLDAINIDLKSFSNKFYTQICGANIEHVKDNIKFFYENKVHIELTTLLIPDYNDSDDEIKSMALFIYNISPEIPWHISRFFPRYKMSDHSITHISILEKAYNIAKKIGLKYVYIGNV